MDLLDEEIKPKAKRKMPNWERYRFLLYLINLATFYLAFMLKKGLEASHSDTLKAILLDTGIAVAVPAIVLIFFGIFLCIVALPRSWWLVFRLILILPIMAAGTFAVLGILEARGVKEDRMLETAVYCSTFAAVIEFLRLCNWLLKNKKQKTDGNTG